MIYNWQEISTCIVLQQQTVVLCMAVVSGCPGNLAGWPQSKRSKQCCDPWQLINWTMATKLTRARHSRACYGWQDWLVSSKVWVGPTGWLCAQPSQLNIYVVVKGTSCFSSINIRWSALCMTNSLRTAAKYSREPSPSGNPSQPNNPLCSRVLMHTLIKLCPKATTSPVYLYSSICLAGHGNASIPDTYTLI